jgi:hypothetical protein
MISSASNTQQNHHVSGTSSPSNISTSTSASVNSAQSTSSSNDTLEESKNGFKNAWLRQLDQEKRVQGTGAAEEHKRVEHLQQTNRVQTVADMLAQERNKKV